MPPPNIISASDNSRLNSCFLPELIGLSPNIKSVSFFFDSVFSMESVLVDAMSFLDDGMGAGE